MRGKNETAQAIARADFAVERLAPFLRPILREMNRIDPIPQSTFEWACLLCGDLEDAEKTRLVRLASAGERGDEEAFDRIMSEIGAIAAAYFRAKAAPGGGAG